MLPLVSRLNILLSLIHIYMPDVLEMPYRPPLFGAGEAGEKPCTCRLAARTCLAGDVIGEYSFDKQPQVGDRLVFGDMAIYSMVKNLSLIHIWEQAQQEDHRY